MAPKSWAIAHPERSATLLALPMRGFMWFTRPAAGRTQRAGQLVPAPSRGGTRRRGRRRTQPRRPARTRRPLGPGRRAGPGTTRPAPHRSRTRHRDAAGARPSRLRRQRGDRAGPRRGRSATSRSAAATCAWSSPTDPNRSGWSTSATRSPRHPPTTAAELMRPVLTLAADAPVHDALSTMRERRNHLALVDDRRRAPRAGHDARPARPATARSRHIRLIGHTCRAGVCQTNGSGTEEVVGSACPVRVTGSGL